MDTVNPVNPVNPQASQDAQDTQDVLIRLERHDGSLSAYRIRGDILARRIGVMTPDILGMLPDILRPLVDTVLFGLRHGPVQKLLKTSGMPTLAEYEAFWRTQLTRQYEQEGQGRVVAGAIVRDSATLEALVAGVFATLRIKSEGQPLDVHSADVENAYLGVIERAPDYDLPCAPCLESQGALEGDGHGVVESSPSEGPGQPGRTGPSLAATTAAAAATV